MHVYVAPAGGGRADDIGCRELVVGTGDDVRGARVECGGVGVVGEEPQRRCHHDPGGEALVAARERDIGAERVAARVQRYVGTERGGGVERGRVVIAFPVAGGVRATATAHPTEVEARRGHARRGEAPKERGDDVVVHVAAVARMGVRDRGDRVQSGGAGPVHERLECRAVATDDRGGRQTRVVAHWCDTVPFLPVTVDDRLPIKMLADRILVKIEGPDGERRSSGGILIPATAQLGKRLTWAEVVGLGPNVRSMEIGDRVLFSPEDRYEVEVRGDDYIILRERDVHAVAAKRLDSEGTGLYL